MKWGALLVLCVAVGGALLWGVPPAPGFKNPQTASPLTTLKIAETEVKVMLAQTPAERAQGLSRNPPLKSDEGMLFIFPNNGQYSFWMKDMLFSIDILWFSEDGMVVHIEKEVSPDSFPRSFTSDSPARYVLEVPAGFSDTHGITIGSRASIPKISSF